MARPNRPKAIPDLDAKTSMANGDLLLLTRLTAAPDDYENFRINYEDFASGLASQFATDFPSELETRDDQALDYFEDYSVGAVSSLTEGFGWANDGVISGGTIVSRTHQDGRTMKCLSLLNGQLGRRMPWGDKWNKLRIIVGWRINASATFQTVNTQFVGVCSGTTNMVSSATTDNAIGWRWGSASGENITFTAGTRVSYFNMGTAFRFMSRRGTTNTIIASGGSGHAIPAVEGYIGVALLRIARPVFANNSSSVTYSLLEGSTQASGIELYRPKNAIRHMLSDDSGASSLSTQDTESGVMLSGSTTVSFDQSTGVLDTLNITWPETTNPLELCCIGVRKLC